VATTGEPEELRWYGVRCLFRHGDDLYEERITLWRAGTFDQAIEHAEAEAAEYSRDVSDSDSPTEYIRLAQAYVLDDEPGTNGAEVFSLIRGSDLAPRDYIDRYFETGEELQRDL
jgi:hypothetical protein